MAGAAYEYSPSFSGDTSFEFTIEWTQNNGDPIPWADYSFRYALRDDDGCGSRLSLASDTGGVLVDPDTNTITVSSGVRLEPGRYDHVLIAHHISSATDIALFDGSVAILRSIGR